ncbi:GNAT family N-acetyltransferase [Paenarthrobacter sp. Z7-10]|uniref:GNAT family N-acetyltransferase n=1 Tax=Paenarthrobacter sp. Z7-10 TaxID=2787635 RepID=UPI003FA6864B|nr:GNAT family N-acetyltransferase [Paenarthrobacter sp. Z7-10]
MYGSSQYPVEEREGQDAATNSVRATLALAFEEPCLHRVQAETLQANAASRRVLS